MGKIFRAGGFIASILAGVWIGWVMFIGSAGTYLTHNPEKLVGNSEVFAEITADIKQQRTEAEQQVCEDTRERFQAAWDNAVENNSFEKQQRRLDSLEKGVARHCKG